MTIPLKIALAEGQDLMRELVKKHLSEEPDMEVIYDLNNGAQLMKNIAVVAPDILILALYLPLMDGWEVLRCINEKYPNINIIILSANFEDFTIIDLFASGAKAVISKMTSMVALVEAIRAVRCSGSYLMNLGPSKQVYLEGKLKPKNQVRLNDYELAVLRLVMQDLNKHEIAKKLCLSVRTVEWYKANIISKTECKTMADLRAWPFEDLIGLFDSHKFKFVKTRKPV